MDSLCLNSGLHGISPPISVAGSLEARVNTLQVSAVNREKLTVASTKSASRFSFRYSLPSLWPGGGKSNRSNGLAVDDAVLWENGETRVEEVERKTMGLSDGSNENWVLKILHVRSLWKEDERPNSNVECDGVSIEEAKKEEEECVSCRIKDDDEFEIEFDRDSFSRLLRKASLAEAKLYAQISYLGNLAYCIPKMKAGNILKHRGFEYVTSSIDKRELATKAEKSEVLNEAQEAEKELLNEETERKEQKKNGCHVSPSAAYHIAASAASYLHSHTKTILPFNSSRSECPKELPKGCRVENKGLSVMNSEVASLMATTDSVTAVVAAKEEVKQAVADDLTSTRSSPCEWFICDDDQGTRFFVIQGSESLASWQANLLFEPVQFEGMDVLVHRGIYEAAKGIYEQMLPEVRSHLKTCGRRATFRFTGHSLGGSLSLLVNLTLQIRKEVPASSLLPVITFGAPSIMCGGDKLLRRLGLPRNHVQAITLHRDIVPRAFSCNYPNHVAELLKAVNGSFRNHPCLNNQKLLYAPMGELLILQPDEKFSPQHHLLPSGSGLYFLNIPLSENNDAEKLLRAAQSVFLNSPHPLEILSDRSAYGSEGAILRDHDIGSYLKSMRSVIRQELKQIRKAKRENRRKYWWSLLSSRGIGGSVIMERPLVSIKIGQNHINFSGVVQTGKESLKRFSRLVASQHMHLLVVLLFPARLLALGAYSISNLG